MNEEVKQKISQAQNETIQAARCLYVYHAAEYPIIDKVVQVLGLTKKEIIPYIASWNKQRKAHQKTLWSDFLRVRQLLREKIENIEEGYEDNDTDTLLKLHAVLEKHLPTIDAVYIALVEIRAYVEGLEFEQEQKDLIDSVLQGFESTFKTRILAGQVYSREI